MVKFQTTVKKFGNKGEKTGWSYVVIPASIAGKLKQSKVSFRVKGSLDAHRVEGLALLPMGKGDFILPFNAALRKATGKKLGDRITFEAELDERVKPLSADFMKCLRIEPGALTFFKSLPKSHQRYFSKWIEDAKTMHTKTKRIVQAVTALASQQGFSEMARANKRVV